MIEINSILLAHAGGKMLIGVNWKEYNYKPLGVVKGTTQLNIQTAGCIGSPKTNFVL